MNVGDIVKWSKAHSSKPGYDYTENWTGIVLNLVYNTFLDDPGMTIVIMWRVHGENHIARYDESFWNSLGYEAFEVISECG